MTGMRLHQRHRQDSALINTYYRRLLTTIELPANYHNSTRGLGQGHPVTAAKINDCSSAATVAEAKSGNPEK